MNIFRFARKCLFDPSQASKSARLVARQLQGNLHWRLHPGKPIVWRHQSGWSLVLEQQHSFTHCFWPAIEAYEPDLQELLPKMLPQGGVFVDCGANVGLFSVIAGGSIGPTGRVISIEANPTTYQLLCRNLLQNGLREHFNVAVSTENGYADFYVPEDGDVYGTLQPNGYVSADTPTIRVETRRLDELLKECSVSRVDAIKIDVEGAEMDVLRGAVSTIDRFRPTLIVEYGLPTWSGFGHSFDELMQFADSRDYELVIYSIATKCFRRIVRHDREIGYSNVVMLPKQSIETCPIRLSD